MNILSSKYWIRLWMPLCLVGVLAGCFNRSQPIASEPPASPPTPPASFPSPSPSNSAIAAPSIAPQPSTPPQNGSQPSVTQQIEGRLSTAISGATGLSLQSLNCPAGLEVKVGNRFDCTAVSDGQSFAIAVDITSTTGPQFQWNTKGLLVLSKLEQFIQQQIKDKNGSNVTADCGGSIRVASPGETFECKVSPPEGQSRSAKITVKDEQGTVDVALI